MVLTRTNKQLATVLPDGTELKYYEAGTTGWGVDHRMGEHKRIYLEYSSDVDLSFMNIYINPATFVPVGYINTITGKGSYFYGLSLPDLSDPSTAGVPLQCYLQTTTFTGSTTNADDYIVQVVPDGTTTFQIIIDFYMLADNKGYLAPRDNHAKLLKDAQDNPNLLMDNNTNVYSFAVPGNVYSEENRSPRVYFYIEQPGAPYPGVNFTVEETFFGFRGGWYQRDWGNNQPWFTNTHFEVIRSGNLVNNLMASPNDVYIFANTDNALYPVTHFVVGVIKSDIYTYDDTIPWDQNYQIEWQRIQASNVSTGKIAAPMTDPQLIGPQQYMANFVVQGLQNGAGYRLIGIAYSNTDPDDIKCNSFISPQYFADGAPDEDGSGFTATATLSDYNHEYEGNDLECCIEERMKSNIRMEFPFDQWKDHVFNRLGLVVPNDIRNNLDSIELLLFEEYHDPWTPAQIIRQYVDMKYAPKLQNNTFQIPGGMTLDFDNTWAEFSYEWRNRFETYTPNVQTTNAGNTQFPPTGNQYWGGKTIKIEWILYFIYPSLNLTDKFIFQQQIRVKDYGEMSVKFVDDDPDDPGFKELSNICKDEEICFAGILQNSSLPDRKLIVNIMPTGAGVNNVEEAEVWVGNELPQLTTNKIVNEEEDYHNLYSETAAKFCIDGSKLSVNSSYQISALAKKYIETGKRITESGDFRITESNSYRTIN